MHQLLRRVAAAGRLFRGRRRECGRRDRDRKTLLDEAFQYDFEMELVCFLLELEDMAEQVYETYADVKRETRTLVDATAVAELQLHYPSIQSAQDVVALLEHRMTKPLSYKIADRLAKTLHERKTFHIPGFFLVEYTWVLSALLTFTSAFQSDPTQTLILRDGHFGDNYDEEFTPHYMLPDISTVSPFFMQQLPLLFNLMLARRQRGAALSDDSLADRFLEIMNDYFVTKKISIPLVFVCVCWVNSVAALQGAGALKRHTSATIGHTREIERRLHASGEKGHVRKADREIRDVMKAMESELQFRRIAVSQGSIGRCVLQANPILLGYTLLHDHIRLLHIGGESVLVTSRLRAFLHLYSALVDRQLLDRIPFIEELLEIYGEVMFTPSRAAAVHGSYCRTYLLSSHMTAAGVDALFRGAPQPPRQTAIKVRDCFHLADLSSTYRLVVDRDLSTLAPTHASLSAKDRLVRVADQCAKEVLQSRVLSRDLLKLNDDLTDLFESLCDGLGRRWYHGEYLAGQEPGVSRQYMINRALEDAVMVPLMPFLDCLNLDGTWDPSRLVRLDSVRSARVADDSIVEYCERAAAMISRRFNSAHDIELSYFLLRPYTNVLSREFGGRDYKSKVDNPSREDHFCELMDLLEDTPGALTDAEIRNLKSKIRADPELLVMVSVASELATIFHLAAAGPGHDVALVDWLIQMGALYWQPAGHFRSGRELSNNASVRINQLAVHSAAAAGHMDTVLLLLEADNMRDLNTPTYHSRECLVHLAVKNGHRDLYRMLVALGADVRGRTRDGKQLSDLTTDREWKREILEKIVEHEQILVCNDRLSPNSSSVLLERRWGLHKEESKKAKKKQQKKATSTPASQPAAAASSDVGHLTRSLLEDLRVGSSSIPDGLVDELDGEIESFEQSTALLGSAFAKLKTLTEPPTPEQEAAAASAVQILDRLQQIVGLMRRPDRLNATPRELRLAFGTNAFDAIHTMNKFDRAMQTRVAVVPLPSDATSVDKLRHMCRMQELWIGFVAVTAHLLSSLGRTSQARELFDVGEKRLLKLQERPVKAFRKWVVHYSDTRTACGLEPFSGDDAKRQLLWYVTKLVKDRDLLEQMDGLYGHRGYFGIASVDDDLGFHRFCRAFAKYPGTEKVVLFSGNVLFGFTEGKDLATVLKALQHAAKETGANFIDESFMSRVPSIQIDRFEFSKTGIVVVPRAREH